MATIKSFTSLEQSKKLAEILPIESADMHWQDASKEYENPYGIYDRHFRLVAGNSSKIINNKHDFRKGFVLPAWSLAALLGVLPNGIVMNKDSQNGRYHFSSKYIGTYVTADNPIDTCVQMILKLHKLNLL